MIGEWRIADQDFRKLGFSLPTKKQIHLDINATSPVAAYLVGDEGLTEILNGAPGWHVYGGYETTQFWAETMVLAVGRYWLVVMNISGRMATVGWNIVF